MTRNLRYQAYYVDKWYDIETMTLNSDGSVTPLKFLGFPDKIDMRRIKAIRQYIEHEDKLGTPIWELSICHWKNDKITRVGVVEFDNVLFNGWVLRMAEGSMPINETSIKPIDLNVMGDAIKNPELIEHLKKKK